MTLDELRQTKPPRYAFERREAVRRLPADETIVAVRGYRMIVRFVGTRLYSIMPRAKSAGRGEIAIDPWAEQEESRYQLRILGDIYTIDPWGPKKLQEALQCTVWAWNDSEGNVDAFYRALGSSGRCAICGATLTDPVSMGRGIGPECIKKIWVGRGAVREVQKRRIADPNWPVLPAMAEHESPMT